MIISRNETRKIPYRQIKNVRVEQSTPKGFCNLIADTIFGEITLGERSSLERIATRACEILNEIANDQAPPDLEEIDLQTACDNDWISIREGKYYRHEWVYVDIDGTVYFDNWGYTYQLFREAHLIKPIASKQKIAQVQNAQREREVKLIEQIEIRQREIEAEIEKQISDELIAERNAKDDALQHFSKSDIEMINSVLSKYEAAD